jgi:hypothetical protein
MNEDPGNPVMSAIWFIAFLASLVHVCRESIRMRDGPLRHTVMVALCAWPLGYLGWVLWWPGSLRQWLFGSDEDRIKREVDRRFGPLSELDGASNRVAPTDP